MSLSLKKVAEKPDVEASPLDDRELDDALRCLNSKNYRAIERSFVDPSQANQAVALISFLPCAGAKPNELGLFGFAKIRGVYSTEKEANDRAVYLIRNIDSVHTIHHVRVGHAFPLGDCQFQEKWGDRVADEKDAALAARLECQPADKAIRDLADHVNDDLTSKELIESAFDDSIGNLNDRESERDRRARESVLRRERKLIEDARNGPDAVDAYITERNKYATVATRFVERSKELEKYKNVLKKSWKTFHSLETPEILDSYRSIYQKTLEECGIKMSDPAGQKIRDNFENPPVFDFLLQD